MNARKATSVKTHLGFLLYGKKGTWKSSLCLEFAKFKREDGKPFRVLYIDGESGSIDTYIDDYIADGIDMNNVIVAKTQSLTEVEELIRQVKNDEDIYITDDESGEEIVALDCDGQPFRADAIVVDGLSLLYTARQQGLVEFSKKRAAVRSKKKELIGDEKAVAIEGAGLEVKDYQTLKFDGQSFILELLETDKHFAVTCREEDVKETVKDNKGNMTMIATGEKRPQGFKDVDYNVKTVIHLFNDEEDGSVRGIIEGKDRTKVHKQNEWIEEPTLLDWQVIIEKNKGKKSVNTTTNFDKSINIETKNFEKTLIKNDVEEDTNSEELDSTIINELHNKISSTLRSLSSVQKAKAKAKLSDVGFDKNYKALVNKAQLEKYLSIISV